MPAEKISISGYGRFVEELLDRLGIDAAAVVGNSMGGMISIFVAAERADAADEADGQEVIRRPRTTSASASTQCAWQIVATGLPASKNALTGSS